MPLPLASDQRSDQETRTFPPMKSRLEVRHCCRPACYCRPACNDQWSINMGEKSDCFHPPSCSMIADKLTRATTHTEQLRMQVPTQNAPHSGSESPKASPDRSPTTPTPSPENPTSSAIGHIMPHMFLNADRHSYSCKRCRRLKKKCSRTKPECVNCAKAGEDCVYVPRAQRRKKSEILRSLGQAPVLQQQLDIEQGPSRPLTVPQETLPYIARDAAIGHLHQHQQPQQPPQAQIQMQIQEQQQQQQQQYQSQYKFGAKPSLPPLSSLAMFQNPYFNGQQQQPPQRSPQQSQPSAPQQARQHVNVPPARQVRQTVQQVRHRQEQEQQQQQQQCNGQGPLTANNLHQAYLSKVINLATEPQALSTSSLSSSSPVLNVSSELLDQCIATFFDTFSLHYPCIDVYSFCKFQPYTKQFHMAIMMDDLTNFEFIMAVLIGYTLLIDGEKITAHDQGQLQEALSMKAKHMFLQISAAETLETVSHLVYFGILALLDSSSKTSWYIDGLLTRLVLSLGLNNTGKDQHSPQVELKNRLFWSAYTYDREVAGSLGRCYAIDDESVDVELPQYQVGESHEHWEVSKAVIQLNRTEGKIMKQIHSINAGKSLKNDDERSAVLKSLKMDIESWYNTTSLVAYTDKKLISNPAATAWCYSAYYDMLLSLYKPSFLMPTLNKETLQLLGKTVGQYVTYLYNLHAIQPLQLTWTKSFKFVSHCTTLVFCICSGSLDLSETKMELKLCIEVLSHYNRQSTTLKTDLINLFTKINTKIYESQSSADDQLKESEGLKSFLREIGTEYLHILKVNKFEVISDKPVQSGIAALLRE